MLPSHHTSPFLDSSFYGRRSLARWLALGVILLSVFALVSRRPCVPPPPPLFEHEGGLGNEQGQGYGHGEYPHMRTKGLDLNSRTPVPSQPPTPTSSKQSFATSAASSQHTRSPPPRSSAQNLTILEGSSCLRRIPLWGCLCLLLILIREWACLILLFPFHFFNPVSRDGRGICFSAYSLCACSHRR